MKTVFAGKEYIDHLSKEIQETIYSQVKDGQLLEVHRKGINLTADDEKSFTSILSSAEVDRDEEILISEGIDVKDFKNDPVILWSHKWGEPPVGSASDIFRTKTELKIKVKMASTPFAQDLWTLIKEKHLRTMSIGFVPTEILYNGTKEFEGWYKENKELYKGANKAKRIFTKAVLIEGSLVSIPANTSAQILEVSKAFAAESKEKLGIDKEKSKLISKLVKAPVDDNKLIEQYLKDAIDLMLGKI